MFSCKAIIMGLANGFCTGHAHYVKNKDQRFWQPRPQGHLVFQYGGARREDPGTQQPKRSPKSFFHGPWLVDGFRSEINKQEGVAWDSSWKPNKLNPSAEIFVDTHMQN